MTETYYYVIWSFKHTQWWAPARRGYTASLGKAGDYTALEAGEIATGSVFAENVAILRHTAERRGPPTVASLWQETYEEAGHD